MSRCPWCAESVPRRAPACPSCGHALEDELGRPVRRLDIVYDQLIERQRELNWQLLSWGTLAFGLASLAVPLLNVGAPIAAALLLVAQMVVLRLVLARRPMQLLSGRRRIFVRWITRLGLMIAGTVGYGATLAPLLGAVAGGLTFALLTYATHLYILRSLEREKNRLPLELWEKLVLIVLIVAAIVVIAIAIAMGAAIGWTFSSFTGALD